MISIDEMQDMLGRMMDELPDVFFRALNGGVNLLPDTLRSPHAKNDDYFILGEYVTDSMMGRYINLSLIHIFLPSGQRRYVKSWSK